MGRYSPDRLPGTLYDSQALERRCFISRWRRDIGRPLRRRVGLRCDQNLLARGIPAAADAPPRKKKIGAPSGGVGSLTIKFPRGILVRRRKQKESLIIVSRS